MLAECGGSQIESGVSLPFDERHLASGNAGSLPQPRTTRSARGNKYLGILPLLCWPRPEEAVQATALSGSQQHRNWAGDCVM